MQIGGYVLVTSREEIDLVATSRAPQVGEEITFESTRYRVSRVEHVEDPDVRATARYTYPRVYVLPVGESASPDETGAKRSTTPLILPFAAPSSSGPHTSPIFPPGLVAVLVVAGYGTQKVQFRCARRECAELVRSGRGWLVISPDEAWRLSRLAKKYMLEAEAFGSRLPASTWPSFFEGLPASLSRQRQAARGAPSRRPTLHLVSAAPAP